MRRMLLAALTVLLLALLSTTVFADGTAVTAMTTECDVEKDGACTLTLHFTVEFAPGVEHFDIPIAPEARDVICHLPHTVRSENGYKLVELTGPLAGQMDITVSYRLPETVTDKGESQSFSVQLLYPAWTCPISAYEVTVHLPGAFESLPTFYSGYLGDNIENYLDISPVIQGTIHAVLNSKQTLQDHEEMSMRVELPSDFFDLRFLAGKTVKVDRLLFAALLLLAAVYWAIFLHNRLVLPKRQAMPPEGGNAGTIPFILTGRSPDLALMVVQWASLGYLSLTHTRTGHVQLNRQMDMDTERKGFECEIFYTLFSRSNLCDVRSAEYLKARRLAREKPRQFWQKRVFDAKAGSASLLRILAMLAGLVLCLACFDVWVATKSWRWLAIIPLSLLGALACRALQELSGCLLRRHSLRTVFLAILSAVFLIVAGKNGGMLAMMALNLLAQLVVGLLLRCGGRRTKSGAARAAELLGYRRWLLAAPRELLSMNLESDPQYFYRILPFADALRVGRAVAVTLGQTKLEPCDWLTWDGKAPRTAPAFFARYERLMAALRGERVSGRRPKPAPVRKRQVSTRVNTARRPKGQNGRASAGQGREGGHR